MQNIVLIVHIIVGVLFIMLVLMQDKGVGFGSAIGGVGGGTGFYSTKRGAEKVLHYLSIILATLFLITAVLYVVVPPSENTDTPAIESSDVQTTGPVSSGDVTIETEPTE